MKVYTVLGMHKIDYDFSVETYKLGCSSDRNKALQMAKEAFEKAKTKDFAKEIERYSNEEEYRDVDEGALEIEEYDELGYYRLSFGFEEDYEVYIVAVDEWEVE
jgi:hypothetical protein